jgi:hypothetical protein
MDSKITLYSDPECKTPCELSFNNDNDGTMTDYSQYQSYVLAINPHANKEHTHTISEIVDYEPYDDTEVRTMIDNKADKEHDHEDIRTDISENTERIYNLYDDLNDIGERVGNIEDKVATANDIEHEYAYRIPKLASTGNIIFGPNDDIQKQYYYIKNDYIVSFSFRLNNNSKPKLYIRSKNNDILYDIYFGCESNTYTIESGIVYEKWGDINLEQVVFNTVLSNTLCKFSVLLNNVYYDLFDINVYSYQTGSITKPHDETILTLGGLRELLYPVGSIYTSMNNINPSLIFGGTWTQIVDRFLYCANSSKQTGGSKKITVAQIPPHKHTISSINIRGNDEGNEWNLATHGGNSDYIFSTDDTGGGEDYMPPFISCYAWYRTA